MDAVEGEAEIGAAGDQQVLLPLVAAVLAGMLAMIFLLILLAFAYSR